MEALTDYKFLVFNGKVKCLFVCTGRKSQDGLKVTFFDLDWNILPFTRKYPQANYPIPRPVNFEKMIELSERLAYDLPFCRVDWYEVNGQLYFGEYTFFPRQRYRIIRARRMG